MVETTDLLFELGTEELPPTALAHLSAALTAEFQNGLNDAKLVFSEIHSFATPRRLGLLVKDCALQQPDQEIDKRGPAVQAAFDQQGNPTRAAQGFASSCGVSVDELGRLQTDKGEWLNYQFTEKGKSAVELLPAISQTALDKLPIPKRMHWGNSDAMFVRPVHWLLFLLGDEVVPCTILDAESSNLTYGHRFHHPQAIKIIHPAEYEERLRTEGKVIADFSARRTSIIEQIETAAKTINGHVPIDEALLDEVTALVEWPAVIVGNFEEEYLQVPHEALILTMKKNQKYFPVFDSEERLKNNFITISNIDSKNPDTIRDGNERVIRPRLSDAKFFWEQDAKLTLENRLDHLKEIVFQKQLGSIYAKSARVSALASHIASLIEGDTQLAERAGLLSRCDLVTEMVFEFADMQGIMGRYQATRDGENPEIAQAMDEIYMPRFSGDVLPQTKTGIAIALADRFDTLTGIFGIGLKPSGTKDPFALRRASLGIIRILREHSLTLNIQDLIKQSSKLHGKNISNTDVIDEVSAYINDRLRGMLIDEGTSSAMVKAVGMVNPATLTDFENRIEAVTAFSELAEADNLAAANKRIHNILKKTSDKVPDTTDKTLFDSEEENSLLAKVEQKEAELKPLIATADYKAILVSLADLKDPIDGFFDHVMVMTDDEQVRLNRLSLLQRVYQLFIKVADVSVLQDS